MSKTRTKKEPAGLNGNARLKRRKRKQRKEAYETHLICHECGRVLKLISWLHLKKHGLTIEAYKSRYKVPFLASPHLRAQISMRRRRSRGSGAAQYRPLESYEEIRRVLRRYARRHGTSAAKVSMGALNKQDISLVRQAARAYGSWAKATKACGLVPVLERRFQGIDPVVRAVRQCAKRHGCISYAYLWKQDNALPIAVGRYFRTIRLAARKLGLVYKSRQSRWTISRFREELRRRESNSMPINTRWIRQEDGSLYAAGIRRFGSWKATLEACGFDYSEVCHHADRSQAAVARDLRRWVARNGPLNRTALRQADAALFGAVARRFGTVEMSANALGLPYQARRAPSTSWSRDLIIRHIHRLRRDGKALNVCALLSGNTGLLRAAKKFFGSWDKALKNAGIDPSTVRLNVRRDDKLLERALRAWVARYGPLNQKSLRKSDSGLYAAAILRMGSVNGIAEALGLPYAGLKTRWSRALVIRRIKERHKAGAAINAGFISRACSSLLSAGIKHFGCWDNALKASGLDPAKVRLRKRQRR